MEGYYLVTVLYYHISFAKIRQFIEFFKLSLIKRESFKTNRIYLSTFDFEREKLEKNNYFKNFFTSKTRLFFKGLWSLGWINPLTEIIFIPPHFCFYLLLSTDKLLLWIIWLIYWRLDYPNFAILDLQTPFHLLRFIFTSIKSHAIS